MPCIEGDTATEGKKQITAPELKNYVRENEVQQSGGSSVPALQTDGEKVLVGFR